MLQSVIKEYGLQSQGLSVVEGQNLASYQTELQTAQRTAQAAVNAEAQYVAQHPALAASPAKQAVIQNTSSWTLPECRPRQMCKVFRVRLT